MEGHEETTIFFTYDRKAVISRLLLPSLLTMILVVSLFTAPRTGNMGLLRVTAFSMLSIYALWLISMFFRSRSTAKDPALYTLSVFLSVALLVQGVYLMYSGTTPGMTVLMTASGAAGIFYYVMINRKREPLLMISDDESLRFLIRGEEVFNTAFADLRLVRNRRGILELERSDLSVHQIPASGFDNTDEIANHISDRLNSVSS